MSNLARDPLYRRHRFPAEIIAHAVWLYFRFPLSLRATPGLASAWRKFELRAYRLAENSPLVSLTVAAAETRVPEHRLFIQRLRQGKHIIEAASNTTLRSRRRDRNLRAA